MSSKFSYTAWIFFQPQASRRGPSRAVAAGTAIAAVAAWLIGGQIAMGAQAGKPDEASAPAANVERGKELFLKDGCYQCHGYVGQGGTSAGPRIAPDPLPWEVIATYIRKPAGQMPPYTSKLVPDQDVKDIQAYLKTMPGPTDIKNIPAFNK